MFKKITVAYNESPEAARLHGLCKRYRLFSPTDTEPGSESTL
jgi:hypothetical protein